MAGEEKEEKVQTGPETTEAGTLADDFSEGPGIQLTGHPAMQEEEPAPEVKKEEAPGGGEEKPTEKAPEFKYKTHEEAEAGAREHQAAFTKKSEEAAREKEARETAERERDELKQKLEEASKPPEKPAEETKPATREEQKTRLMSVSTPATKKALAKIKELDRTDEHYDDQVAAAWAEATTEALLEAGLGGGVSQEAIDKMVAEKVKATYAAERDADKTAREEKRKKDDADEAARIEAKARELGTKVGLDLDDPESADSIIWDRMAKQIPQEVYDKNSLEAQVEWVAAEVRQRTGKVAQTAAEREEAARIAQNNNTVLGKGGVKPKKPSPKGEDLGSLGSDFAEVREQRTIS
jgi:hypothetical protein